VLGEKNRVIEEFLYMHTFKKIKLAVTGFQNIPFYA